MKTWYTTITAIHPVTGELKVFEGPLIKAPSSRLAQEVCESTGRAYCKVVCEFFGEIPCDADGHPDFSKEVNYTLEYLN